jgi:S-adenosylmethionine/arginine decarboxylase-like enzyme
MTPITRPYVIYDRPIDPEYISGILVVAQSHIAVHYDIKAKKTLIDIFSCEFLNDYTIRHIMEQSLGTNYKCFLVSRGSKHDDNYKRKVVRISESAAWKTNI